MKPILPMLAASLLSACTISSTCSFSIHRTEVPQTVAHSLAPKGEGLVCRDVEEAGQPRQRLCQDGDYVEIIQMEDG